MHMELCLAFHIFSRIYYLLFAERWSIIFTKIYIEIYIIKSRYSTGSKAIDHRLSHVQIRPFSGGNLLNECIRIATILTERHEWMWKRKEIGYRKWIRMWWHTFEGIIMRILFTQKYYKCIAYIVSGIRIFSFSFCTWKKKNIWNAKKWVILLWHNLVSSVEKQKSTYVEFPIRRNSKHIHTSFVQIDYHGKFQFEYVFHVLASNQSSKYAQNQAFN